ncbi:MAG: ATP-binding protein [Solirubrobacteraceae bacterium]
MYKAFFGLTQPPLGKESLALWDGGQLTGLTQQFNWLLQSPGVGLLTAEPGLGKTAALRQITRPLNPHQHSVFYISHTDFSRLDFYRELAVILGVQPSYRRAQLWRDIKAHITHLVTQKNVLPVLIIDEGQNLPFEFFRDFPSFLNFIFDSKEYMTVWLVGHPELARDIDRPINRALASRIQARVELKPILDREAFKQLLIHGFTQAGCTHNMLSDSGIELLQMASKGNPRQAHRLVVTALRLACDKKITHLPDDIINEAISVLKSV